MPHPQPCRSPCPFALHMIPEFPLAGVLQVEAMAQLAGLVMLDPEDTAAKGLFFFGGIEGCRFRKPVVPGDVLVGTAQWINVSLPRSGCGGGRERDRHGFLWQAERWLCCGLLVLR